MAEDEFVSYKDISELKKELDAVKGKKDISQKDLYDIVQKLADTMADMLEVFGAAAEQMKSEDKEYEAGARKHEQITSKLDKIIDQNRTMAQAMVGVVDMIKQGMAEQENGEKESQDSMPKPQEEPMFMPKPDLKPEPRLFMRQTPTPPSWQPRAEPMNLAMPEQFSQPMARQQPSMPQPMAMPSISPPLPPPDFGMQMPPMEPAPSPDFDFPEEAIGDEPKKKGLFGMFKK